MSCFRLTKKLLPSKKACKSFISTFRRHLPDSLHKTHHRLRPNFRRSITRSRSLRHMRHQYSPNVYVDRLFPADPARPRPKASSTTVEVTRHHETGGSSGGGGGKVGGRKWKEYLESLPPIRGVDERAEEFITSFRQQMKIEREQSLLDFQEMLARSS